MHVSLFYPICLRATSTVSFHSFAMYFCRLIRFCCFSISIEKIPLKQPKNVAMNSYNEKPKVNVERKVKHNNVVNELTPSNDELNWIEFGWDAKNMNYKMKVKFILCVRLHFRDLHVFPMFEYRRFRNQCKFIFELCTGIFCL